MQKLYSEILLRLEPRTTHITSSAHLKTPGFFMFLSRHPHNLGNSVNGSFASPVTEGDGLKKKKPP